MTERPLRKRRTLLLVVLASVVATVLVGGGILWLLEERSRREAIRRRSLVRVMRYARSMRTGEELRPQDMDMVTVAKSRIDKQEPVVSEQGIPFIIGRVVNTNVKKGQYVLWRHTLRSRGEPRTCPAPPGEPPD